MATTALDLRGIDQLPDGGWRVRMMIHGERFTEAVPTLDAALILRSRWRELRAAGYAPEHSAPEVTLREACDSLIAAKRTLVQRGRRAAARTIEDWLRKTKPWREGEFAGLPVSMLRTERVRSFVIARAATAPTAAKIELQGLKAALREAERMGATVAPALFHIEPIATEPARLYAYSAAELRFLGEHAPAYVRDLVLFLGTTGLRLMEAFTLTADRVDLDGGRLFIPAELCKERRDKWVELTAEEVALLRRQLMARPAGADLVFTKSEGGQWQHRHWWKLVVGPVRRDVARKWRAAHRLADDEATPFDGFRGHWLRATAATLMRDAGFTREEAATRLGHDGERLLDALYDQGDRSARVRRAIDAKTPRGLLAHAQKVAPRHATTKAGAAPLRRAPLRAAEALESVAR